MSFTEYQGEVIPLADEFTEYSGEVIPLDGAPKTKRTWGEAISETGEKVASGVTAVGEELGKLRDSFFTGVDNTRASGNTVATAAQAAQLQKSQDKLAELMSYGQGDTPEAQGLRTTIEHYSKRMPKMIGDMTDAQADAQRGAAMTTRPAVAAMGEAKTFGEAWDIFKKNPYDVIAGVTATSLPGTLPALVVGATMGPAAGAAAMGGSSAITEAGSSIADFARDSGVDTTDRKAVETFFANRENLAAAMSYAGKRAGIIGALDAASGGIAGKTIAPAFKSAIARQAVNVPAQMAVQAGMGAGGEAGAQIATKGEIDKPGEVLMEAAGELGGAPMEVAAFSKDARSALMDRKPAPAAPAVVEPTLTPEDAPESAPLQIGNTPDPMIGFPDGTVARRSEVEANIARLPEDQRAAARAQMMGLAPQPAKVDPVQSVMATNSVDEAIAAANAAIESDRSDLDSLVQSETRNLQVLQAQIAQDAIKQQQLAQVHAQSVEALGRLPDQQVAAARAATDETPTAMQLAMQRAQEAADRPRAEPAPKPKPAPLALENQPDPLIAFPDGSVARRGEAETYINSLPPEQQTRVRAKLFGMGEQPTADAVAKPAFPFTKNATGTVLVTGDPVAIRAAFPDARGMVKSANGKPVGILFGTSAAPSVLAKLETPSVQNPAPRTDTEAKAPPAQTPAPAGGEPVAPARVPGAGNTAVQADGVKPVDQRLVPVSKRNAVPSVDVEQKPAASLANPAQAATETVANASKTPESTTTPSQGKEVYRYTGKFGKGMGKDAARLEAKRLNRISTDKTVTYSAEEHNDPKLENPYAVVGRKYVEQKQAPALVERAQPATETVASERAKTPEKAEVQPTDAAPEAKPETPADPVADAKATLDANNITGKERLDIIKDVKAGTLTAEEVKEAYPEKADKMDAAEPAKPDDSVRLEAKSSIGLEQPVQEKPRNPFGTPTTVKALQSAIKELTGLDGFNKMGRIVATTASEIKSTWEPLLGKSVNIESEGDAGAAQGFFDPKSKTIFLIADHIREGAETAVLAHELMHKYGKTVLGKEGWDRLHSVIGTWANADRESNEHAVYNYARNKVEAVGAALSNQELMPYCVEAAFKLGIEPDMQAGRGTVARWLESVRQNMKMVWAKITGKPETFKAQDLVNLAFGLSQMENPEYSSIANDFENQRASSNIESAEDENERTTENSEAAGGRQQNSIQDMATSLGGKPAPRGWSSATRISRAGRPITVYRGASEPLNVSHFGKSSLGKASGNPSSGLGVWFTTGKGEAQTYGKASSHNLDIRNPKLIRAEQLPGFDSVDEAHAYREELRKQGYDGILISARHLGKQELHIVAFEPDQVIDPNGGIQFSRSAVVGQTNRQQAPEETTLQAQQRTIQDKFNRFKVLQEWVKDQGVDLSEAADVYLAETLMSGRISSRKEDFRERQMGPLIEKTQKAGFSLDQVVEFLKAQHAPEANKRAREIHANPNATAFGVTDQDAKSTLDEFKALPDFEKFKEVANEWRSITEQTRDILLDSGILSKEMVAAWEATYSFYVPVKGTQESSGTGKGLSVNGKTKRRMGHELRDEAIIENILRDHERAISLDENNLVGKALIRFAIEAKNDEIITVGSPIKRQVLKPGQTHYMVTRLGTDVATFESQSEARQFIAGEVAMKHGSKSDFQIDATTDPARVMLQVSPMLADNEVTVYVGGSAVRVQIHDEIAARAYTNLGVEHLNTILSAAREVNSWLSKAYTGYSPDFIFTNPLRDATQGFITLTGEHGAGMAKKIFAQYPHAVKELIKHFRNPGSSKLVTEYRASGGSTGGAYLSDLERIGNDLQAAYNEHAGALDTYNRTYAKAISEGRKETTARTLATLKAGAAGIKDTPVIGHFLRFMERVNAITENALRVATFDALTTSGMSKAKAAAQAKNLMNFNRKGEISNQAGALYLFFNPSVQGSQVMYRALMDSPHKKEAMALGGMMVLAAIALAEMALSGGAEDADKWKNTPAYLKDGNWIFGFGDYQATLTLPYGYRIFHTLGNVISDFAHGADGKKLGIRLASAVFSNFSPVGNPMEGNLPGFQLLPTLPKMLLGPSVNEDGFGREIGPKRWNDANPDSQMMHRATKGSIYSGVAEGMNSLTGGSKYQKGLVDVSPETLKYWVRSLTGGAGQAAFDLVTVPSLIAQDVEPAARDIPIVRRFVREIGVGDARGAFWERAKEAKQAADEFAAAKKANDVQGMRDILKESGPLIALAKFSSAQQKVIKAKRDAIDAIRLDDKLTLKQKHERMKIIEMQETAVYTRFVKIFDSKTK